MAETQFPIKKIILILGIILIIMALSYYVLTKSGSNNINESPQDINPTGILKSPDELSNNELDIIKVDPEDQSNNIGLNKEIVITFSRNLEESEFELFISPDTPINSRINGDKVTISPLNNWQAGTQYTYSINLRDYPQKIRLYNFQTSGPTQKFLPDTQPTGLYEKELQEQLEKAPDIFLVNQTPYENEYFSVTSYYEQSPTGHFAFRVQGKTENNNELEARFNVWLQAFGLTQEQINTLDIRYE